MAVYKGDTEDEIDATDAYNMALQTLAESSVPLAAGGDFASTIRKNWPVGQMKFADGGYAREGYQVRGRVKPPAGATAAIEEALTAAKNLMSGGSETSLPARVLNALGLYSHGAEAAANLPQAKGTAEQMVAMLRKQGVKQAELKNAGLIDEKGNIHPEWAGKSVTKDELAQHLQGAVPQLEENILTDKAKYADKTLAGGENYRELLLKSPSPAGPLMEQEFLVTGGFPDTFKTRVEAEAYITNLDKLRELAPGLAETLDRYPIRIVEQERRLPVPEGVYGSDHWPDPNVLAHLRMSDRTGPNGEKLLHVEEIQSDWGQEGRKRGFKQPPLTATEDAELTALTGDVLGGRSTPEQMARMNELYARQNQYGQIPTAPYVTSTPGWTDLALKRAMKEAAEGGHSGIVFTPGSVQAERWPTGDEKTAKGLMGYYDTVVPSRLQELVKGYGPDVTLGRLQPEGLPEMLHLPITDTMREGITAGQTAFADGGYAEGGDPEIEKALRLAQEGSNPMEFVPNTRGPQQPAPADPTVDASGTGKWGRAFAALTGGRNLQNDIENVSSRIRPYEDYSQSFMDALEHSAQMREMAMAGMRSGEPHKMGMGATMIPLAYMNQAFAPITAGADTMMKTVRRFDPRAEVEANIMGFTLMPTPNAEQAYKIARDVLTAPAQMTAKAVHTAEAVPGGGSGHLPGMASNSLAERQAYTDAVRSALEDPRGRDVINKGVGLDAKPNKNTTGAWQPPTGPIEINPGFAAGSDVPLIYRDGNFVVDPEVEQALRTAATVRGGFTAQFGSPYNAQMVDRLGNNLAIDLPSRIKPDAMMNLIAKYGMDDFATADTGSGANILNWGDRFSKEQAGDITQTLGGNLYSRTREATNPNMNYVDLSKEWQAGAGSRQVTERMINELTQLTPERLVSLDNPELANSAGKLLDVYVKEQAQGGQVRPDLMNMLQIVRDKGLKGLQAALGDPAQLLPALTAIGLAPSVYESATEDR